MPSSWADAAPDPETEDPTLPPVVREILLPINRQKGDELPVSAFRGREDGTMELGLTAYEKRGIAVNIPRWTAQACLQCNLCSLVCPHAAIRPFLLDAGEAAAAPAGLDCVPAKAPPDFPIPYRSPATTALAAEAALPSALLPERPWP